MGEEEGRKCRAGPPTDKKVCFSVPTKNLNMYLKFLPTRLFHREQNQIWLSYLIEGWSQKTRPVPPPPYGRPWCKEEAKATEDRRFAEVTAPYPWLDPERFRGSCSW